MWCINQSCFQTFVKYLTWTFLWKPLTIFAKSSTLDVWQVSLCTSVDSYKIIHIWHLLKKSLVENFIFVQWYISYSFFCVKELSALFPDNFLYINGLSKNNLAGSWISFWKQVLFIWDIKFCSISFSFTQCAFDNGPFFCLRKNTFWLTLS